MARNLLTSTKTTTRTENVTLSNTLCAETDHCWLGTALLVLVPASASPGNGKGPPSDFPGNGNGPPGSADGWGPTNQPRDPPVNTIPEPSTLLLSLAALGFLVRARRR